MHSCGFRETQIAPPCINLACNVQGRFTQAWASGYNIRGFLWRARRVLTSIGGSKEALSVATVKGMQLISLFSQLSSQHCTLSEMDQAPVSLPGLGRQQVLYATQSGLSITRSLIQKSVPVSIGESYLLSGEQTQASKVNNGSVSVPDQSLVSVE